MNDLGSAPFFASLNDVIDEAAVFLKSDSLMLITTADLHSILALGFLESAFLTNFLFPQDYATEFPYSS